MTGIDHHDLLAVGARYICHPRTALGIAGTGRANPKSLIAAIRLAALMAKAAS
jgi:hypothetical protein